MIKINPPSVLTIAGSDTCAGAGIQADLKAISATGSYAATVITALTAQNTLGVQAIFEVSPEFVTQQLDAIFSDLKIRAVKIGMLLNEKIIEAVAAALEKYQPENIVLDPVMISKNGSTLLKLSTIDYLKEKLLPCVHLLTPNLFEAEKLLAREISTSDEMALAAKDLATAAKINVLVKGGHLASELSSDVLYQYQEATLQWFHAPRIQTKNTHGTGCSLSAAIASYLAQDYTLVAAIVAAKKYLSAALIAGSQWQLGSGQGPLNHFYLLGSNNE